MHHASRTCICACIAGVRARCSHPNSSLKSGSAPPITTATAEALPSPSMFQQRVVGALAARAGAATAATAAAAAGLPKQPTSSASGGSGGGMRQHSYDSQVLQAAGALDAAAACCSRRRPSYDSQAMQAAGILDAAMQLDILMGPATELPPAKALKRELAPAQDAVPSQHGLRDTSPAERHPLELRPRKAPQAAAAPQLPPMAKLAQHAAAASAAASAAAAAAGTPAAPAAIAAAPPPAVAAAAMDRASSSAAAAPTPPAPSPSRRVRFAPGPLPHYDDGHPPHEGRLARAVRHLPPRYPMSLTKGSVLMLEQLLHEECSDVSLSVTRLKRRVGLLPAIRPPRPHVSVRPAAQALVRAGDGTAEARG